MTPMNLFPGERALVTGSASSIGRGIAIALAREGADVLLADIDPARNAETQARIRAAGGKATAITCDLATRDGWRAVIAETDKGAAPAMFVHSASPPRHEKDLALDVDEATFDAMVNTNLRSGFFLGREVARRMTAAGVKGRMLYLTSLHTDAPRNHAHYSAGKGGMRMVVKELARALGPDGIRVNALAPGAVPGGGAKSMTSAMAAKIPLRRTGTPADMAATALAMLSDRFTPYVTGTTIVVDGGLDLFNWIAYPDA